jgi:eukaryotic-like serine/threonine-protein kinase
VNPSVLARGRYQLEHPLGQGGMARVHLGRDVELDRPVAVKLIAEALADDESFRARFLREARLAARLSHPNVVQIYDVGEDKGRPFIVMEYVEGETLADELARAGPLAPADAVARAVDCCAGLEHAHAAGLVHRDIKPRNLLRRHDGVVKIADFGIARANDGTRLTEVGSVMGTAAYIAPEQAAGEEVTAAADLYALGAILYELITGTPPHGTGTASEILLRHHKAIVTPVRDLAPEVPPALEAIVMRCLARDPRYRPSSAAALAHALADAVGASETLSLPDSTGVRATDVTVPLWRPQPRTEGEPRQARLPGGQRAWRWFAIAAAVAVALALGLTLGLKGEKQPGESSTQQPLARVEPADNPTDLARNFSRWLRSHAGS